MNKEGTYNSDTSNGTLNYKSLPCSNHDKQTEITEQVERLKEINNKILEKEVRKYSSGAKRDGNSNKPYIHNLLGYTRQRFGYHMTTGSNKYGDGNWLKGLPTECYLESVDRHLAAYMEGDRSEDHLSAIIFGIQGCMINEKNQGIKSNHYFTKEDEKN